MDEKDGGPPSAKSLDEGYNQTYLVTNDTENKNTEGREVFFRCGNWCYKGQVQFNGLKINTEELPILIPTLQRQQGSLRYFCNSKSIPEDSDYCLPLRFMEDALEFIASELTSEGVEKELRKMSNMFSWIDEDSAATYFELALGELPSYMRRISLIASKTYTRGLIIISIFYERAVYFVVQNGEGDQPLLDVRFPDVSKHGQGLHLNSYNDSSLPWRKLTLWHVLETESMQMRREIPKIRTLNVASKNYEQTYCILKNAWDAHSPTLSVHHDVLFRFGSWCYAGRVQLTPSLSLADIPYVIPALRMQQSRLDFLCDVSAVPTTSPFAPGLQYMQSIAPRLEEQIVSSEDSLKSLIARLSSMGLGESVTRWLEGDPSNSFFEFKTEPDAETAERFKNLELVVSKCYHPSGIITMTVVYQHTVYVSVLETNGENPLLDSRFPDISGKGRGYQLQACNDGIPGWPQLRKVSIWQTVGALEQEFREKAAEFAQSKSRIEMKIKKIGSSAGGNAAGSGDEDEGGGGYGDDIEEGTKSAKSIGSEDKRSGGNGGESKDSAPSSSSSTADSPETLSARAEDKLSLSSPGKPIANSQLMITNSPHSPAADYKQPKSSLTTAAIASPSSSSGSSGLEPLRPLGGAGRLGPLGGSSHQSLPHHVPKMDALSKRMEDIRRTMGDEGLKAPWDSRGRPLGAIGSSGTNSGGDEGGGLSNMSKK